MREWKKSIGLDLRAVNLLSLLLAVGTLIASFVVPSDAPIAPSILRGLTVLFSAWVFVVLPFAASYRVWRGLYDDTNELRVWRKAQRDNPQQYVHVRADGAELPSGGESRVRLRIYNALHENISIDSIDARFFQGDNAGSSARLSSISTIINRGGQGTVTIVANELPCGTFSLCGNLQITAFDKPVPLYLDRANPDLQWEIVAVDTKGRTP